MSYQILIRSLFIIAACNGEPLIRRGMGLDGEEKATMTSNIQKGHFQLVHKNRLPETHPDFHAETKGKTHEPITMHSHNANIDRSTQRKVQARASIANHQEQQGKLTNQALRRRTVGKCKGLKKIVECKDDVPEEVCKNDLVNAGVEVVSDMPNTVFFAICVKSEEEALLVAELIDVAGVEDDPPRTLSYFPGSEVVRHLQSNEQIIPYGVELVKAPDFWNSYGKRGGGIKVCVIDTGLRTTHEDLKDGNLSGSNYNGLVTPWNQDGHSHGTHVSGIIAAADNYVGVIGVAPDVSIHVVRVFDNYGELAASSVVDAMNACASAGANIINMSFGGTDETSAERNTVQNLKNSGILLVAAAGNDADGLNRVEYPAGYEPVLSVGAVDENLNIAVFSTHNAAVDIAGPGVDVLSTISSSDGSYGEKSGTSMATPHIAGVAALLWSQFPGSSVDDIHNALIQSARDYGACGKDRLFGHGVVDVMAAAEYLSSGSEAAPELGGCVDVSISLTTDDRAQETYYIITLDDDDFGSIVYRGGPYQDGLRTTYTDNIKLQEDCYNLILLDLSRDG